MRTCVGLLLFSSLVAPATLAAAPAGKPQPTSSAKSDFAKLIYGPVLQRLAWPLAYRYESEEHAPQSPAQIGLRLADLESIPKDYVSIKPYRSALLKLFADLDTLSGSDVRFLNGPDSLPVNVVTYKGSRCLVITVVSSDTYNTLRLSSKQRAAKALSSNVLPVLRTVADSFSSENLPQYAVFVVYGTRDFSQPEKEGLEAEVVGLVVPKRTANSYIGADITDRQVVTSSAVLFSERESLTDFARIEVTLE